MSEGKLSDTQREVLLELEHANHLSTPPLRWCRPMDIGGRGNSFHSGMLNSLAKIGLVQSKQRGMPDPPDGENGPSSRNARGSKCYRITPAGRAALTGSSSSRGAGE